MSQKRKAIVADALAGASAVVYLTELDETARTEALRNTGVLLTFNTSKELQPGEAKLLNSARLIQFMIGGVDFIPLGELPEGVPVATNGGGYAESMAERQVTVERNTMPLPKPFLVIATQNPVELEGTFPLPEAQLDRFLLGIQIGYPSESEEQAILHRFKQEKDSQVHRHNNQQPGSQ